MAFELIQFPDVLQSIAKDLSPNKLCTYLYHLSGKVSLPPDHMRTFLLKCMRSTTLLVA